MAIADHTLAASSSVAESAYNNVTANANAARPLPRLSQDASWPSVQGCIAHTLLQLIGRRWTLLNANQNKYLQNPRDKFQAVQLNSRGRALS